MEVYFSQEEGMKVSIKIWATNLEAGALEQQNVEE